MEEITQLEHAPKWSLWLKKLVCMFAVFMAIFIISMDIISPLHGFDGRTCVIILFGCWFAYRAICLDRRIQNKTREFLRPPGFSLMDGDRDEFFEEDFEKYIEEHDG